MQKTLHSEFAVHKLNDHGLDNSKRIAEKFDELLSFLEQPEICVQGRELSIVKTKLEEACFFAKKAMAINLSNQQH